MWRADVGVRGLRPVGGRENDSRAAPREARRIKEAHLSSVRGPL